VVQEGGFSRAAERLGMAVQTVSMQVRDLEKALGHQLLKPSGQGWR
jgi:LysR family transcriptional activator of nhaA